MYGGLMYVNSAKISKISYFEKVDAFRNIENEGGRWNIFLSQYLLSLKTRPNEFGSIAARKDDKS